jgi:ParB/RepB/Spo0J family partition protein
MTKSKRHPAIKAVTSTDHVTSEITAEPAVAPAAQGVYRPTLHAAIRPDPENPRKLFDDEGLAELEASIVRDGLAEPLLLRPVAGEPGQFMLIAGERRWRAIGRAIAAGSWPSDRPVDAMVREADDRSARRLALVENLQRRDLNAIEEARALQAIAELDGVSAAQIGRDLGFTERWAQQRLSLLKLPEPMQRRVAAREIKVEEAREAVGLLAKLPTIKAVELRDGKITVREAREWLEAQPAPLELSGDQLLILLEVGWCVAGKSNGYWTEIECDYRGAAEAKKLEKAKLLAFGCQRWSTGKTTVRLTQASYNHLISISGCSGGKLERAGLEPLVRKARVTQIGGNPLSADYKPDAFKDVDQLFKAKRHVTSWLNAPHEVDPQLVEERRRAKAAERERDQKWDADRKAEQAARDAQAAAKRAEVEAEAQRGKDLLGQVLALEGDPSSLASVLAGQGYEGPFSVGVDGTEPVILDGNGKPWRGFGCGLEALRRVMVLGLNVTLGLKATSGAPIPDAPWANDPASVSDHAAQDDEAPPRAEFVRWIADFLVEDCLDLPDDQAEALFEATARAGRGLDAYLATENIDYGHSQHDWSVDGAMAIAQGVRENGLGAQLDLEEAIAATDAHPAEPVGDAEIPGFLRRLAGGGAEPALAEAGE